MTTRTASQQSAPKVTVVAPVASGATRRSLRSIALVLVVLAVAVRIAFMLGAHTYLFHLSHPDDQTYFNETTSIARSIAEGRGFSSPFSADYTGPSSWIAPVYPYLCALFFSLFGVYSTSAAIALLTLQSLFSALTCVPILGIAERTAGRRAGIAAAALWAVFPWFSKWAVSWVWEITLSALLFACLFWLALRMAEPAARKLWIGFGALWGFSLLVNPALLPLLAASLLWCGYQRPGRGGRWSALAPEREFLRNATLALFTCVLVISPWLVRNRVVFGQWAFLRSNFGFEFYLGNNRFSIGRGWGGQHPTGNPAELARYKSLGELNYVRLRQQEALQWVRNSPVQFATLTARRVLYFWDGSAIGYRTAPLWYWMPWSFAVLSFLMLPGMLVMHRRRVYAWPLFFAAILLYPIPYYLTYSQVRYRHVLEPLMLLLVCGLVPKTWLDQPE